jgi:hypothetical protein
MGLIITVVVTSAILANGGLRALGLRSMPIRYALATALSYALFFLLVWIWLAFMGFWRSGSANSSGSRSDGGSWIGGSGSARSGDSRTSSPSRPSGGGGGSGGGGASASFEEAPATASRSPDTSSGLARLFGAGTGSRERSKSDEDSKGGGPLGALGALLVFILPLIVIGAVCYYLVSNGPDILGDIALQAILARAVLRRALEGGPTTWPEIAFRRTIVPFAIVLAVVLVAGGYAQHRCPPAATLAEVLRLCGF